MPAARRTGTRLQPPATARDGEASIAAARIGAGSEHPRFSEGVRAFRPSCALAGCRWLSAQSRPETSLNFSASSRQSAALDRCFCIAIPRLIRPTTVIGSLT